MDNQGSIDFGAFSSSLFQLETEIGIMFFNKNLLEQAFIHGSFLQNNQKGKEKLESNQRLEFLGDAVISVIVSKYLYEAYPKYQEGKLSAVRAFLVNNKMLGGIAYRLEMHKYLRVSSSITNDTKVDRLSILADTYEAYVGALLLDLGYAAAEVFLAKTLLPQLDIIVRNGREDWKSFLVVKARQYTMSNVVYSVVSRPKIENNFNYVVSLALDSLVARASAKTREAAEQLAAKNIILSQKWI